MCPPYLCRWMKKTVKGQGGCRLVMAWAFCARSFSLFLGHGCCRTRRTSWIQRASLGSHWKSSGIFSPKNKKDTAQKQKKKIFFDRKWPLPLFGKKVNKINLMWWVWVSPYFQIVIQCMSLWALFCFLPSTSALFLRQKRAKNFLKNLLAHVPFPDKWDK